MPTKVYITGSKFFYSEGDQTNITVCSFALRQLRLNIPLRPFQVTESTRKTTHNLNESSSTLTVGGSIGIVMCVVAPIILLYRFLARG